MDNPLDWNMVKVVVDLMQWALAIGVGIYAWWIGRNRDAANQLTQLKKEREAADAQLRSRLDKHEKESATEIRKLERDLGRVQGRHDTLAKEHEALEKTVSKLPGHGELSLVRGEIADVSKQVGSLNGTVTGMNNTLRLINEHLMKGGKG